MPNPLDYTGWDTFKPAVGPGNAFLGSALQADPNATYGTVLPYAVDNATGARRFAMPSMLRSFLQGGVDLADGPSTGTVTPDASGTLGLLAGSNVLARGGDGLLAAAGPKLKLDAAAMQVLRDMTPGQRAATMVRMASGAADVASVRTATGDAVTAHVNPSGLDVAKMFEKSPDHVLRVLREGPNHAIWPAYDATHAEMAAPLGFTKDAERLKFYGKPGPPDDLHPHKAGRFSFGAVDQQELPPMDFHDQK